MGKNTLAQLKVSMKDGGIISPMKNVIELNTDIPTLRETKAQMSKGEYKTSKLRIKPDPQQPRIEKPRWIKAQLPKPSQMPNIRKLKNVMRERQLHSVCEEASCPNLPECFGHGTATFMIMGHICTRKCPFCDVEHGRPNALDENEPMHLATTIAEMDLKYVVLTSVDRDDLKDCGAGHFTECVRAIREHNPNITIESLVPDFRSKEALALEIIDTCPPDVFNHNLESIPRLYEKVRPGASYEASLQLLKDFKARHPNVPTKSGLMVGLGEEIDEILEVMRDLRAHGVNMLTVGQYLQPSIYHLAVERYVTPDEFKHIEDEGYKMGFDHVASGPMVRSSYHADLQHKEMKD